MRICEGCHGYESLHNIQVDSDGTGDIVVGSELPGYGHVGADDPGEGSDCWGCHGFTAADASAVSGPIAPSISTSDVTLITAGIDTQITLTGSGFINFTATNQFSSDAVTLTAFDGGIIPLSPFNVSENSLSVIIPGTTPTGSYELRVLKGTSQSSNPLALVIKPEVVIHEIDCSKCLGTMTIAGSGFSEKPDGTDQDLYVIEGDGGRLLEVISWTDTEIKVLDARCRGDVTVNTIFGSTTAQ